MPLPRCERKILEINSPFLVILGGEGGDGLKRSLGDTVLSCPS
ncbi:hypothetical protein THTE_0784 [Thermogutta terrifontis]|uniref:Uncharacterized protein n=1 Tax=Thermogutta terrifontis TaxID=1331910 RepID=A0A286RBQ2_9BACT|nr:hypothetical protein THTE_0784 [Thermogutta terrifontis]